MTAKRRKGKLKTSFKFFLAVFLLAFLILVLKLCGGGDEPEKNITVEPSDEAIISVPTVEYERHNEFIRIKRFTDGEKQYSYPILDGYSAINVRVEKFVNELLITQNTVYLENVFYNASYYSMKFSDGSCLNYDVRNNMPMELEKVAPNITRYTVLGLLIGVFLSVIAVVISALLDDAVHDEEYVLRTYDYPILGKVPDLLNTGNKSYGYYSAKQSGKGRS